MYIYFNIGTQQPVKQVAENILYKLLLYDFTYREIYI